MDKEFAKVIDNINDIIKEYENEKFAVIDVGASNQRCYEFEKDTNSGKYILEN